MKKINRLVIILILFCAISIVFFVGNVSVAKLAIDTGFSYKKGTQEHPYQLNLGDTIIDIEYKKDEATVPIFFEFTGGNLNAANYLVDNNKDKGRLRFTLIGNSENDLMVTAEEGIDYVQAGGICYIKNSETEDEDGNKVEEEVQIPYYKIVAYEQLQAQKATGMVLEDENNEIIHQTDLGNGYLNHDLTSNFSNYATSYIFSKSNLDYSTAYNITDNQIEDGANFNLIGEGDTKFIAKNTVELRMDDTGTWRGSALKMVDLASKVTYTFSGPVRVIYSYNGTNSPVQDAEDEKETKSGIESLLSKILIAIGDVFVDVSNLGETKKNADDSETTIDMFVTIDSLVFNEYPNTIVDFFGNTQYTNAVAKEAITFWYNVFKAWAIIMYIIFLSYIGIKVVLATGTAEQKKVKPMIEGWLTGVLVLFCFPILFKYLITINDMFVDVLRTNTKYSVYAYYTFADMYEEWRSRRWRRFYNRCIVKITKS